MKITGDELVELMFLPMTDIKIVEMLDSLGIEQPVLDEQYEMDLEIAILDGDNSGFSFSFKELDGYSLDGEPCLVDISFEDLEKTVLPFGLKKNDNYSICCEKLNGKADFIPSFGKKLKIWTIKKDENTIFNIAVHYQDTELTSIRSVVVNKFDKSRVGDSLLPNKD